jgi:hypothetical protein
MVQNRRSIVFPFGRSDSRDVAADSHLTTWRIGALAVIAICLVDKQRTCYQAVFILSALRLIALELRWAVRSATDEGQGLPCRLPVGVVIVDPIVA